jgi:ornithine carbamoyltransferase
MMFNTLTCLGSSLLIWFTQKQSCRKHIIGDCTSHALTMIPHNDVLPSKSMLHSIIEVAKTVDSSGFSGLQKTLQKVKVIGRILQGASPLEARVTDITAARLDSRLIDLGWPDAATMSTEALLDSIRMSSAAVDLMLVAFSSSETFGEGRILTGQFADASLVPFISLHDDIYAWQDALTTLLGLESRLQGISGKQIVITWGFGNSFVNPAPAHSLSIAALAFGANVRIVTPSKFSFLNRVCRVARDTSACCNVLYEEDHEFEGSLRDADAVFALNWQRLDDFNHPERNQDYAKEFKDWFVGETSISEHCVFSSVPPVQSGLLASHKILDSERNITPLWLKHRTMVLAATIAHMIESSTKSMV